jgi:cell wall-associated NlpC family hydrolase
MATIKLFLGIFCFAFIGGNGMRGSDLLKYSIPAYQTAQRNTLVRAAISEIGVRELTGNNDGPRVEEYLRCVGLKKGQPWCAAYVSYIFAQGGFAKPRSGWSPDMFPAKRLTGAALPGNVLGIYFKKEGRIAHVGIIIKEEGDYLISAEGNTSIDGSREGDGVYLKRRHRRTVYQLADWITLKQP